MTKANKTLAKKIFKMTEKKNTKTKTDKELLDWLEKQEGINLVSSDNGFWCCTGNGWQDVPAFYKNGNPKKTPMNITTFIKANEWKRSIREAISAAMIE